MPVKPPFQDTMVSLPAPHGLVPQIPKTMPYTIRSKSHAANIATFMFLTIFAPNAYKHKLLTEE